MNRVIFSALIALSISLTPLTRAGAAGQPVAKVGDTVITDDQMRQELGMQLYQSENQMFMIKKNWVDQKAMEVLFNKAAKDAGLSRQKWEEREINAKAAPVDEERAKQVAGQFAKPGVDSMETLKMAKDRLAEQNKMMRKNEVYMELSKTTPVEILFTKPEAPRITVAYSPEDPVKGDAKAPVTLVEFTDFQCPFCQRSQATLKQIEQAYPKEVKFVARQYPLPFHDRAKPAAEAALCAHDQGKFWQMREKLFEKMELKDDDFKRYAKDLGLNSAKFEKCLSSHKYTARVENDIKEGQKYGVTGTPAFFINGEFISGAQPFPNFDAAIKSALAQKKS